MVQTAGVKIQSTSATTVSKSGSPQFSRPSRPVSKHRNAVKSRLLSRLFLNCIYNHSFGGLGADTLAFISRLLL
jgi:hypothetical protein